MIEVRRTALPNGLRLVAVEMPHLHSAEMAVYLKVGGRDDPAGKAGLTHFVEHMLFRGSEDFPTALELETAFERIGGSVNAATDTESTCYYSRVHPDHLEEGIRLLSSLVLRPTLREMETEKRIVMEEAREDLNEQGEEINPDNLSSALLWPQHPLGMPTVGYLETVAEIGEDDLRRHLADFYLPSNAVVAVAGRVKGEEVFAACEKAFGGWQGEAFRHFVPVAELQGAPRSLFVHDSDSQVSLQIAFRGFPLNDHRIMEVRFLRRILCGGGSSRLHLLLRERLGIIYSVDASIAAYRDTGSFSIDLSTLPENLPLAVSTVLEEVRRMAREPVPEEEMERVREAYLFDLEFSRDSTYEMQSRYGWGEIMNFVRSVEEDTEDARRVQPSSLAAAAGELFAPARLNLVAVGPVPKQVRAKVEESVRRYSLS